MTDIFTRPTALIATALSLETDAVLDFVEPESDTIHPRGARYPTGQFITPEGSWRVVIVQVGKGNPRAAAEVTRAIDYVHPSLVLFVGIAGGVKDVRIGDIVVGDKVYYVESGKAVEGSDGGSVFQPRPEADRGSYELLQLAESIRRRGAWRDRARPDVYTSASLEDAKVVTGPIAAGEIVLASKDSEEYKRVRTAYGDAVAVEMEGHGFSLASYLSGGVPNLVLRGVSDLVEGKSDADSTGSQPAAARRAAAFAFELLAGHAARQAPAAHQHKRSLPDSFWQELRSVGAELYPKGPHQRALWESAGGDPSELPRRDNGRTAWFEAVKLVRLGGGGASITAMSLVREMALHFPNNDVVRSLDALANRE